MAYKLDPLSERETLGLKIGGWGEWVEAYEGISEFRESQAHLKHVNKPSPCRNW